MENLKQIIFTNRKFIDPNSKLSLCLKLKSVFLVIFWWLNVEVKLLSRELLVDIQDVLTSLLEVTGWVVRACDPQA